MAMPRGAGPGWPTWDNRPGMSDLAIIGGTGLTALGGLEIVRREPAETPWGAPSAPLVHGRLADAEVVFLARHGEPHTIPPHRVNYRANVWALHHAGVRRIVAVAAVGGIRDDLGEGAVAIPDQIIDYTWCRGHTFFEEVLDHPVHVDFTSPYCGRLRDGLLDAARRAGVEAADGGTYAATQGPRLESAAEIDRLERDGCDLVGMTGMPEAALVRELEMSYAHCAVVANRAAGRGAEAPTMEAIRANLESGMAGVRKLLAEFVSAPSPSHGSRNTVPGSGSLRPGRSRRARRSAQS